MKKAFRRVEVHVIMAKMKSKYSSDLKRLKLREIAVVKNRESLKVNICILSSAFENK